MDHYLRELLSESWENFQNEIGYDKNTMNLNITREDINYSLHSETGEPIDNGQVKMVNQTIDWPNYLFGNHLDQNQLTLSIILKNRKFAMEYFIPITVISKLRDRFSSFRENLPPSSHYWEEFLNTKRDLIQNEYQAAIPDECLEAPLVSFVTNMFDNEFQKEFEVIRSLDIASKKIKINLIKSEIATLFGLMLTSNIISNTETKRLAKVIEAEFYTEKEGKGKKKIKPLNLESMDDALRSFTSRVGRRDTAALKSKAVILELLEKF